MNIWEVIANEGYKDCILIDDTGKEIYDSCNFFMEEQDSFYQRKIVFTQKEISIADISNYWGIEGTFVVNQKTKKIFEENFEKIQFIPLICEQYHKEKFWLINVLNYQNVLDINRCKYDTMRNIYGETIIHHIKSYSFVDDVCNLDIFKITVLGKKFPLNLFVTDNFKQIIDKNNLTGLNLRKIYES